MPTPEKQNPRVGTTLKGKYRIDALIGEGGMATVYRGTHRNGNPVAVKMLHPHLATNQLVQERFLREGYVANKVGHRGAVRVLDDDVADDGAPFLVMELLDGETLDSRLTRNPEGLPAKEVIDYALQLLEVLMAAHAQGIVHRDLKPENLFITTEAQLKVLDFGIARLREPDAVSQTRTGTTMGTPAFMAPEQALGSTRDIDGQTDIWAVGATMFTLLSGRFVHEAETGEAMRVYAGSRPARSLSVAAPTLASALPGADALIAVVDTALKFDKRERFVDVRAMHSALVAARTALELGLRSQTSPSSHVLSAPPPPVSAASGARATQEATAAPVSRAASVVSTRASARRTALGVVGGAVAVAGLTAWLLAGSGSSHSTAVVPVVSASSASAGPSAEPKRPSPHDEPALPAPSVAAVATENDSIPARASPAVAAPEPKTPPGRPPVVPNAPPKPAAAPPANRLAPSPPERHDAVARPPANALDLQIK